MKKINLFKIAIPLSFTSIMALTSLTTVGCSNPKNNIVATEVSNAEELNEALHNSSVSEIKLTNDIEIDVNNAEGLIIKRNLILESNDSTDPSTLLIKSTFEGENGCGITVTGKKINVGFKNINIFYNSTQEDNSIINVDNAIESKVDFSNCFLNWDQFEKSYISPYALRIAPTNIEGLEININDNSSFVGYAAIYNQGSKVTLNASNSEFLGINKYADDDHDFSTIVVADFPKYGKEYIHSFGCDNIFTFKDCSVDAANFSSNTNDWHQRVAEIRCIANNHLYFNDCTCTSKHHADTVKTFNFLNIEWDYCAFPYNDSSWIQGYQGSDKPDTIINNEWYYAYYAEGDHWVRQSSIEMDGKPISMDLYQRKQIGPMSFEPTDPKYHYPHWEYIDN